MWRGRGKVREWAEGEEEEGRGDRMGCTWCISIVTTLPALTGHLAPTPLVPPTLQRTSALPTLVTGLLDAGGRTHWEPWKKSAYAALCRHLHMGKETYHVDAVHPELLKGGMRSDVMGDAQEGEVCVLHDRSPAFVL